MPPPLKTLRVAFGPVFDALRLMLAERLSIAGVKIESTDGFGGAAGNLRALQQGEADIVIAAADAAYFSFLGELDQDTLPFDELRGITVLQLVPIVLVAGAQSGIRQLSDLPGHSVNIGRPDTSTALMARAVLQALDIDGKAPQVRSVGQSEAARELIDGTLDAMFAPTSLAGDGLDVFTRSGARIVPLTGPRIDRIFRDQPFLRPAVINRRAYPDAPILTLGADSLLVCRSDLDSDIVYSFTKQFFDLLSTGTAEQLKLQFMDGELAPATPIPLHEGAARYYREREMLR